MSNEITRLKEFCLLQAISTPTITKDEVVDKAKEYLEFFFPSPVKKDAPKTTRKRK